MHNRREWSQFCYNQDVLSEGPTLLGGKGKHGVCGAHSYKSSYTMLGRPWQAELPTRKTKIPTSPVDRPAGLKSAIHFFAVCTLLFFTSYIRQDSDKPHAIQKNGKNVCHKEKDECMW